MGEAGDGPARAATWRERLLREPLVVFLLAGSLLFAVYAAIEARRTPPVLITEATRAALIARGLATEAQLRAMHIY